MKRTVCLLLLTACLLSVLCFNGCGFIHRKPKEITYTSEIIINEEAMPDWLVWYSELKAPTQGKMLETSKYETTAVISSDGIYEDIPNSEPTVQDFLGMTDEEYSADISWVGFRRYLRYEDTTLYHFHVDSRASHNGQPTTYAGQFLLAEKCGNELYLTDVTGFQSKYSTDYTGRIGSIYYFEKGYYDLTTHEAKPYESRDELPPMPPKEMDGETRLGEFLEEHETVGAYLKGLYCMDFRLMGDRLYAVMATENMHFQDDIEDYAGENLYLVTIDIETERVLYLQKYHLDDYFGRGSTLYRMTDDRELLAPMVKGSDQPGTP